jgi:hypothetical protein
LSPGTLISFANKTDRHDIAEILLKVALNTINQPNQIIKIPYDRGYCDWFSVNSTEKMCRFQYEHGISVSSTG